jgi:hypothetical protein
MESRAPAPLAAVWITQNSPGSEGTRGDSKNAKSRTGKDYPVFDGRAAGTPISGFESRWRYSETLKYTSVFDWQRSRVARLGHVDTSRRALVETLNYVQINARCDRRRFMSKGARNGLQVGARCKRQRRERMAEIVEPDVWKLRAFDEPSERKRKRGRLPRRAVWTRKDPAAFVSFREGNLIGLAGPA